ncbi:MAG: HDOD domain-containing protein [Phycisphaerales bacterium]|nr:HDOD domain-containing protein [Phycisphaerales bacterium]
MIKTTYESLKSTDNLPSPKGVALEIIRLANSEETTLDSIAAVIETDPAMAQKVLKLVNSPLAGMQRTIASVRRAVTLLGLRTVKSLALGFSLVADHKTGHCSGFDYERFWSESLARAAAARRLTVHVKDFSAEEVFACGLVSQIGRLALATVYPQAYATVLEDLEDDDPVALAGQERESLGIDHNELASNMMADFFMPELFQIAVRAQAAPDEADLKPGSRVHKLACILNLSGQASQIIVKQLVYRDQLSTLTKSSSKLGISPDTFQLIFDSISQEWRELGTIFEIKTRQVPTIGVIYTLAMDRQKSLGDEEAEHQEMAETHAHRPGERRR